MIPLPASRARLRAFLGTRPVAGRRPRQPPTACFQQRNLVSDGVVPAAHVDPNLVNAWGVAFNPFGFVWVADADGMVSTLYDGDGNVQSLVVQIPSPDDGTGGNPTGIVFNGSTDFVVSHGALSGPSRFLFATEQGVIAGWAPNVDVHARDPRGRPARPAAPTTRAWR